MEHTFTLKIKEILEKYFGDESEDIFEKSTLMKYINFKTLSVNRGSKSRSCFNVLYSIYTLIEDYLAKNYDTRDDYSIYQGARFTDLWNRAKSLPFGDKIQNHYFNNRTNHEFKNYDDTHIPILHDTKTKRYWINEHLLKINVGKNIFNISKAIIEIIDEYSNAKHISFDLFISSCKELKKIEKTSPKDVEEFIIGLIAPNVDARLFEIVSYAILKYFYHDQNIIWGYDMESLKEEKLILYKTGRTNANDGGIDFVMKPLGRFFQVTETLDFKKYFLDIDKIQKYPITFVIKSDEMVTKLLANIKANADKTYAIQTIVDKYMACIEEVINIPILRERFVEAIQQGYLKLILDEIILQSKVEFNYDEVEGIIEEDDDDEIE